MTIVDIVVLRRSVLRRALLAGAIGTALVATALSGSAAAARSGSPSPKALFGCPLQNVARRPALASVSHPLAELGLEVVLPKWLKATRRAPQRVDFQSKSWRLSLRSTYQAPKGGLSAVRVAAERTELGASHAARRCERAVLRGWLPAKSDLFRHAELGVYGRPLGLRRRTFALFLTRADGRVLTATLTGKWKGTKTGPDLRDVAAIFGAILAAPHVSQKALKGREPRPVVQR